MVTVTVPFPGTNANIPLQKKPSKAIRKYIQLLTKAFDPSYLYGSPTQMSRGGRKYGTHPLHGTEYASLTDAHKALSEIGAKRSASDRPDRDTLYKHPEFGNFRIRGDSPLKGKSTQFFISHDGEYQAPRPIPKEEKVSASGLDRGGYTYSKNVAHRYRLEDNESLLERHKNFHLYNHTGVAHTEIHHIFRMRKIDPHQDIPMEKAQINVAADKGKSMNYLSRRWVRRALGLRPYMLNKHEEQRGPYLNEIFDPVTRRWRLQYGASRPEPK